MLWMGASASCRIKRRLLTSPILRFATARNYFVHHSFKDGLVNTQVEKLPREILFSCLETLVYMESVVQKIASRSQKIVE